MLFCKRIPARHSLECKSTLDDPLQVATMRQMRLSELLATQSRAADWQAFVECSPLPLAHSDADINTFMSIFEQVSAVASDCLHSSNPHRLCAKHQRVFSTISNTFFFRTPGTAW